MNITYIIIIALIINVTSFILAMIISCCIVSGKCSRLEEQKTDNNTDLTDCIIAVDFDNTLAVTRYPEIIEPIDLTCDLIRKAKENGATIILWTCREGKELEDALNWCKENNVPIDYANENAPERIKKWNNDCRKIGADIYIDDRAINPLRLKQMKG